MQRDHAVQILRRKVPLHRTAICIWPCVWILSPRHLWYLKQPKRDQNAACRFSIRFFQRPLPFNDRAPVKSSTQSGRSRMNYTSRPDTGTLFHEMSEQTLWFSARFKFQVDRGGAVEPTWQSNSLVPSISLISNLRYTFNASGVRVAFVANSREIVFSIEIPTNEPRR